MLKLIRYLSLKLLVLLSVFSYNFLQISQVSAAPSQCGPVINGSILNFSFECLNDMTALVTSNNNFNWQYVQDSIKDGLYGSSFGGIFEIHGIAFKESNEELFIVIKAALDTTGVTIKGTLVTYGDLFLNFSGLNFKDASDQSKLYGIRFVDNNDSAVPAVGLYKEVKAKSVSETNYGYTTLQLYEDAVNALAGAVGYGSLDQTQTYYSKDISHNVIESGTFLGNITMLSSADLLAAGYDASVIDGTITIAFKFPKILIIDQCGVFGGDGTTCLDCAGTPCGTSKIDVCGICAGDGTKCLDCAGVPNGEMELDQCGVCGGDGTSCLDCNNVVNGTAKLDQCGVCGGDGTSCLDCLGVIDGNAKLDQCGICGGNGTSCLDCNNTVNGTAKVDQCGVCGGDGTSCLDCNSTINGSAKIDQCGVCGGDGTSCLDCTGAINGSAKVDQCGVCGGNGTSCLDCNGTVNGSAKIDQCGICGGDGKSCLDCNGTANGSAKLDRCGVCNGNGQSCLGCSEVDLNNTIVVIDNSVREQKASLATLARQVRRIKGLSLGLINSASSSTNQGNKLYLEVWQNVWALPTKVSFCSNLQFCSAVSNNSQKLADFKVATTQLYQISINLLKKTRRALKNNSFGKKLEKKIISNYELSLKALENYPSTSSSCS